MGQARESGADERGAMGDAQVAAREVELRGERRGDETHERDDAGATGSGERDRADERKAEIADRVLPRSDLDDVPVRETIGIEHAVRLAVVLVREVEVVIGDQALHDDQVVRLVRGRRHRRVVVRHEREVWDEQHRGERERGAAVGKIRDGVPEALERVRGPRRDRE